MSQQRCNSRAHWAKHPLLMAAGSRKRRRAVLVGAAVLVVVLFGLSRQRLDERLPRGPKYYLAANFYNNEATLPNFHEQLLQLVRIMGPSNVFVSVYENGSTDRTKSMLKLLKENLDTRNVANAIVMDPTPKPSMMFMRRVHYLAGLRNRVLEPLRQQFLQSRNQSNYDKLIFFNDVFFNAADVVRLIQTNGNQYDVACAMDYFTQFYDNFATRDRLGRPFGSGYFPYTEEPAAQGAFLRGKPVPVFSCWNALAVFTAAPFEQGVQFRALQPLHAAMDVKQSLEASECCLIFADLRQNNLKRIYINPNVKVSYEWPWYMVHNYISPWFDWVFWVFNRPNYLNHNLEVKQERVRNMPRGMADAEVQARLRQPVFATMYPEDEYCIQ